MNAEPSSGNNDGQNVPGTVIVGVGNLLMKDEGVGIHVVRHLQEMDLPPDIELIDGGTAPDLIAYTQAGDKLIIVDAAQAGGEPGTVYRFLPEDLSSDFSTLASAHELGVEYNLGLMSLMANVPDKTVIIGVEPKEIAPGMELTDELQQKMPKILDTVLKETGVI